MGREETDMIIKDYKSEEDLAGIIENEGLDYFFMDYLATSKIEDVLLREIVEEWKDRRDDAINRLRELGVEVG